MAVSTRIYCGGALAFGGPAVIADLKAAGYDTVIVWSVHVNGANPCSGQPGDLILNDTRIVTTTSAGNPQYAEATPMNLPIHLASLRQGGKVRIIFSVGSGGVSDWTNIQALMGTGVPTSGNVLYDNFKALKDAMAAVPGGDIDAIDFDNEDNINTEVMVNFGQMLANIGYKSVTLCPYSPPVDDWGQQPPPEDPTTQVWIDTLKQLDAANPGFVSAIHLQCYSGGSINTTQGYVGKWIGLINAAMGSGFDGASLMIPGLAAAQNDTNTHWWNSDPWAQGACVTKQPGVAQYGEGDWSGHLMTVCGTTPDVAMQLAQANGAVTFFFFCNEYVTFGGRKFFPGDAVFFTGTPRWGGAPQCDGYYRSCGCSDVAPSGCPSNLQAQYTTWKTDAPGGGFIWMYDSILSYLTSGCCGGTPEHPAATATAYREAITNGLS
ncbi:MAG TPA: hypothetical protein VGB15_16150 [Longimicrobium sp.]|jgi:hypothetical protein